MKVRALFVSAASPQYQDPGLDPHRRLATGGVTQNLMAAIQASTTVVVSEAVLKKLSGLDSVDGIELVAELDLPQSMDFSQPGDCGRIGGRMPVKGLRSRILSIAQPCLSSKI